MVVKKIVHEDMPKISDDGAYKIKIYIKKRKRLFKKYIYINFL